MAHHHSIILLLLFIVVVTLVNISSQASAHKCIFTPRAHIHIINRLDDPKSPPLKLHCASKNDDLGFHTLSFTQEFTWTFCENFLPTTLFFCHLWWGSKQIMFDAFKQESVESLPLQFYWYAMTDGIYMSRKPHDLSLMVKSFDWY
ncbi:hypothetical protein OROGR_026012 [Orobanche gracilis]